MSADQAELTLILKARNLADVEFGKIRAGLEGVATKAGTVAADMAAAFKGIGRRIANQMGNIAQDILSGGNLTDNLFTVGVTFAGAMVEGLMAHFIPGVLARVGATATFAPMAAVLAGQGATLGGVLAAAIPIGMAALPFLIAAAAVAALVYLVTNPEARQKARDAGIMIVKAVVGGLASLPGKIADVIRQAFQNLKIDVGPFHISAKGVTIDLPTIRTGGKYDLNGQYIPGSAAGGWVGMNGPEIRRVGELGPEYVRKAGTGTGDEGGGGGGFRIQGISEREILDMVDRGLYFKLRRAAPTVATGF